MRGKKNAVLTLFLALLATLGFTLKTADAAGSVKDSPNIAVTPPVHDNSFVCTEPLIKLQLSQSTRHSIVLLTRKWFTTHQTIPHTYPRWQCRFRTELRLYQQRAAVEWNKENRSFTSALKHAAKRFHVSYNRLLNCALSEGLSRPGEPWKWNGGKVWHSGDSDIPPTGSSGAGGWGQFMKSTLYGNMPKVVPHRFRDWHSKVGQAYTMAYMFSIGQNTQWTGAGCN